MSIVDANKDLEKAVMETAKGMPFKAFAISQYQPTEEERTMRQLIIQHFTLSDVIMQTPRVEFNDLSVLTRLTVDKMGFNTYQPNNGENPIGDEINDWKSNAMKPVIRNKVISIAAHTTARLLFPKLFAYNRASESQQAAAQVMSDLVEWSGEQSDYKMFARDAVLTALWSPVSIVYTEYNEVYREVKREREEEGGKWKKEKIKDEYLSGFQNFIVPCDELYIENFFQNDIQRQGWLIWRRVRSYTALETEYKDKYKNWRYVRPGVQVVLNDANQTFYQVYDANMKPYMGEELIYWNKSLDVRQVMVNGVLLTDAEEPNPRNDKLYPFVSFGYELIDERKCFYYKSAAFKMMQDANIVNTLYPMIIDGTYLNLIPPMVNVGGEIITSDVIVPGAVTTLKDPNSDLRAIKLSENLAAGMNTLFKVEESINDTTNRDPIVGGRKDQTAYELSLRDKEAQIEYKMFVDMIGQFVKDFGRLRVGDILQYLTIADVNKVEDDPELVYKTFYLHNKTSGNGTKTRKIQFDGTLPDEPQTSEDQLKSSYGVLAEQGGMKSDIELCKVNPTLFRDLFFMVAMTDDVLTPMSEEVERQYNLETFDRAIQLPTVDQEVVAKDFLFSGNKKARHNPDKYFKKEEGANQMDKMMAMMGQSADGAPMPKVAPRAPVPQTPQAK